MPSNIINTIREQVASDIRLVSDGDKIKIGTPLLYDDGDACGFFLDRDAAGQMFLTDLGDILFRAGYADVDLRAAGHRSRFERTLEFFGVSTSDGMMVMPITNEGGLADSIFTFAQASIELVKLANLPSEKKRKERSRFRATLSRLITEIVPRDRLEERWHDQQLDPNGYYPVDFRIRSPRTDWYVFGVGSENCLRATISCQAFKLRQQRFSSLAIYRDKTDLPDRETKPLDEVVNQKFDSISESDRIADFIHNNILAA